MTNLIGNSGGRGGGGGGAIIAVPLLVIASYSVRSGLEGCGRQSPKYIDNVIPHRIETKPFQYIDPYNPYKKFDHKTYPYDPYPHYGTKEKDDKTGDIIDIGKDVLEEVLEPKDSSDKKNR